MYQYDDLNACPYCGYTSRAAIYTCPICGSRIATNPLEPPELPEVAKLPGVVASISILFYVLYCESCGHATRTMDAPDGMTRTCPKCGELAMKNIGTLDDIANM